MSINVLRQITMMIAEGNLDYASGAKPPLAWNAQDVPDKYKLLVSAGEINGGFFSADGSTSHTIPLPEGYSSANRLFWLLSAFGQVRVTIASPAHSNSVFTLNGSTTLEAVASACERVTSITVTTPTATDVKIRYSLFQLPDLTDADSFRGGVYNYGSVT